MGEDCLSSACHDGGQPVSLGRQLGTPQRVDAAMHTVKASVFHPSSHARRAKSKRAELRQRDYPVLPPRERDDRPLAPVPAVPLVEFPRHRRRFSASGGHAARVDEIACRISTREARS
jgi:hypothetical protein